ncbi:MAG: carboxypeptidase regulatory-like domain-containing protein [Planctomycetes bacterium]|nr:carboxypeptidase regulatory-like domain-containing protein [Planctomycetota bacterium]MCW8137086.1 carboxypeptidase regulatory-like domain-containing protein [Planctomycetota bacterium]
MAGPRLSLFNVVQGLITVVAVLFGVYGFMQANPGQPPANYIVNDPADIAAKPDPKPNPPGRQPANTPPTYTPPPKAIGPVAKVPSNPDDRGHGIIHGTVVFDNGKGVPGARVTAISTSVPVNPPDWNYGDLPATHAAYDEYFRGVQRNTREIETDSHGRFRFGDLDAAHSYRITVGNDDLGSQQQTAKAGATLKFTFEVPVIVTGTVSSDGGVPAEYTVIVSVDHGGYWGAIHQQRFRNKDGSYRIRARAGKVRLAARAHGWLTAEPLEVTLDAGGAEHNLKLSRAATLYGTVTDTSGAPLANATIMIGNGEAEIYDGWGAMPEDSRSSVMSLKSLETGESYSRRMSSEEAYGQYATTDAEGNYRVENLRPGKTSVNVYFAGQNVAREVTLAGGDNREDFSIDAGCRAHVSARDTQRNVLMIASAWFTAENGNWANAQLVGKADGVLEYAGLPEGAWICHVMVSGFAPASQKVQIGRGSNPVSFVLETPARLSGKLSVTGKLPQNTYIALRPVVVEKDKEKEVEGRRRIDNGNNSMLYARPDGNGNYRFEAANPGQYTLTLEVNQNDVLYKTDLWLAAGDNTHDISPTGTNSLTVTVRLDMEGVNRSQLYVMLSGKQGGFSRYELLGDREQIEFTFLPEGEYYVSCYVDGASQQYVEVTVRPGSNTASLSIGKSNCVRLTSVGQASNAADAGLKVGDLVVEYNGAAINGYNEFVEAIKGTTPDQTVTIIVIRDGATMSFAVKGGKLGISGQDYRR